MAQYAALATRNVEFYASRVFDPAAVVAPAAYRAARCAYRGTVGDKLQMLSKYRFALAIENARFPGYISEKLFDCFFAGCVPIYRGAPDVAEYVPRSSYIDADQFATWREPGPFLRGMGTRLWSCYLESAQAYLASPGFTAFSAARFASALTDALVALAQ